MSRILIIFLCVVLVVTLCCLPASAEDQQVDGNTVLNYLDYISAYDIFIAGDGYAYISFNKLFTSEKSDLNGYASSTNGDRVWSMTIPNSSAYSSWAICNTPGGRINKTYIDLSNIPSGSKFAISAVVDTKFVKQYQVELLMSLNSGISYFDKDFNWICDQASEQTVYSIDSSDGGDRFVQPIEMVLNVPDNAVYGVIYSRANFAIGNFNDSVDSFDFEFQFSEPYLKISTSYTQIIVNALVQAKPPAGYGTIIDVGDVEDILNNATQDGQESAEQLFLSASDALGAFYSGLAFMTLTLNSFFAISWVHSILIISLALGIFAFVVNISFMISNKADRATKQKQQKTVGG